MVWMEKRGLQPSKQLALWRSNILGEKFVNESHVKCKQEESKKIPLWRVNCCHPVD